MKNNSIRKIIAVSIIVVIIIIGQLINKNSTIEAPLCENGVMDLTNWNFSKNGNVKLNGDWEFYPNKLLSPIDFKDKLLLPDFYIKVPNPWHTKDMKNIISDKGVGTYRLKIKVNHNVQMYGLKTINIRTSDRIFVNGKEIGGSGNPSLSFEEGYIGNVIPQVNFFPYEGSTIDIIIQVANLDYYNGGIIQSIYLGNDKNILDYKFKLNTLDTMCISFLLLTGIYYLGIYTKKKDDKRFLYFSISCMVYVYIIATSNEKIFNQIFTMIPFMIIIKVKIAAVCLNLILTSLFISEIDESLIPIKTLRFIIITMSINITLALLSPINITYIIEKITALSSVSIYFFIAALILRAIIYEKYNYLNRKNAFFILVGIMIIMFQYVSNILYYYSIITNNIIHLFTLLFLLIGIATMLLGQYRKAYIELEIMSRKLIATDKIKDEFLINTSHEFKTPLHGIINIAEATLTSNEGSMTERQEENLSHIVSMATRLSSLVNDIIDFQSLKTRSIRLNKKIFDINGTVQAMIEVLKYMRKDDSIKLINSIPVGIYYIYTDENRFKQIIVNLISNSLKYTEKGYVEISAEKIDDFIHISIVDTGIGIDENAQKELFIENKHNQDVNFTEYTSSGLGLSISKLLASNLDGDLYLKWSKPDLGSIFVVKIPVANEEQKKKQNEEKRKNKSKNINVRHDNRELSSVEMKDNYNKVNLKKVKFLIVDDEVSNIKVLQEIFNEEKYEILIAYDGFKALELIKIHKDISVVLLDVMMPGLSGYEVCKKIRQEYRIFELPILLMTVRNTSEDIATGLEAGANDFLVKPFNGKELKARVGTLEKMKEAIKEAIKVETIFLQFQIKPHFLYNALSVIMFLCYSDGERAGRLIGELSNYLRCNLDLDPYNLHISLRKEISLVKSYIELEKARFGDRLKVEFDVGDEVLGYHIPALIIQPIVENSIRHGLMKRISGGTVWISVTINNNTLEVIVHDDGLGISTEKLKSLLDNNNLTGSIGLKNVNKRLLNEYGQGLSIKSIEGEGTNVTFNIPIKMRN